VPYRHTCLQLNANQPVGNYCTIYCQSPNCEVPDLNLTCTGIRALPFGSFDPQNFAGFTNVAILRYRGARVQNPPSDPNANIPESVLPLKETDLHVGLT